MKARIGWLLSAALLLVSVVAFARPTGYQAFNVAGRGGASWQGYSPQWAPSLTFWVRSDLGITSGVGPVTATGTSPPTVTLSGAPTASQLAAATPYVEIDCTTLGALGTSKFTVKVNGSVTATNVASAASGVVLTGSGLTAGWAVGASAVNDVYTANIVLTTWSDQSGNSNSPTQGTASHRPIYVVPTTGPASLVFAAASSQDLVSSVSAVGATGWTIAQEASYATACQSAACYGAAFGTSTNGNAFKVNTAPFRDLTARGVVDRNDGAPTASVESWIGTNDATTTKLFVNGLAVTLTNSTTNAVSSGAAVTIGADETGATFLTGSMYEAAAWSRVLDVADSYRLSRYQANLFGSQ